MNDLLQATGYAAIVYVLFNSIITFGSGRPLVEWINPGRRYLPLLAGALAGGSYTSLNLAAKKYQEPIPDLLFDLVGKQQAKPEVVGAVSLIMFGAAVLMTFAWCWWFLPRAPQTFNPNPKDLIAEYRRALRHYVKWAGGLDFAMLCEVRHGEPHALAEGADDKDIFRGLRRLPGVHARADDGTPPAADVAEQKDIWKKLALDLFGRWSELNKVLLPARQGRGVGVSFDVRYGAVYAEMLEDEQATDGAPAAGVYLFAACLNQHEVATMNATRHFAMLSQAVRHIRRGVAKG